MSDVTRDDRGRWIRDDAALALLVDEIAGAVWDGFTALLEEPVNRERIGAVLDRLQELREVSREIDPAGKDTGNER